MKRRVAEPREQRVHRQRKTEAEKCDDASRLDVRICWKAIVLDSKPRIYLGRLKRDGLMPFFLRGMAKKQGARSSSPAQPLKSYQATFDFVESIFYVPTYVLATLLNNNSQERIAFQQQEFTKRACCAFTQEFNVLSYRSSLMDWVGRARARKKK